MRRGRAGCVFIVTSGALGAPLLPGCTHVLGVEPLPAAVPFDYAEPGCAACMAESCQAEEDACRVDEDCRGLHDCLARCSVDDWECRGRCELERPRVLDSDAAVALDSCERFSCLDSCFGTRIRLLPSHGPACEACLEQNCAAANRDCIGEASCERALRCLAHCTDPECTLECVYSYGTVSSSVLGAYKTCLVSCPGVCPFGELWDCVGDYAWGKPEKLYADISLGFTVRDWLGHEAPGMTVQACADVPPPCQPVDTAVTDERGGADLEVNAGVLGFAGYFVVSGQLAGGDIFPNTLSHSRPMVRSEWDLGGTYLTRSEVELIAAAQGITLLGDRGQLGMTMFDCSPLWARNVQFEVETSDPDADPAPTYYYPGGTMTDDTGTGFLLNAPPGPVSVTALYEGAPVGHFTGYVPVRTAAAAAIMPEPL